MGLAATVAMVVVTDRVRWQGDGATRRKSPSTGDVVMLGDSITEQADWAARLPDTETSPTRATPSTSPSNWSTWPPWPRALTPEPSSSSAARTTSAIGVPHPRSVGRLDDLLTAVREQAPEAMIVVQPALPRDDDPDAVTELNDALKDVTTRPGLIWLDLQSSFDDSTGRLRPAETSDGAHLTDDEYRRWASLIDGRLAELDPEGSPHEG